MKEFLHKAEKELKIVDHSIYVSLKYTRTVDIIKHIIERLISSFDFMIEALLLYLKKKKKIKEIPVNIGLRYDLLKEKFKEDSKLLECLKFYLMLRKIDRAEYTKEKEYRRHVTMTIIIDGESIDVDIDTINEYYEKTKKCLKYVETIIS